jgi:transcriptional regulator with XRE-family HTH domain
MGSYSPQRGVDMDEEFGSEGSMKSEWIRWADAKGQLAVDRKKVDYYREMMRERGEGVKLADLRKAKKLTQQQLAKRLKIDQSNVSRIERGKFDGVEVKTLKRYIKALGGEIEIRINFAGRSQKLIDSEYEARLARELKRESATPRRPAKPRKVSVAKARRRRTEGLRTRR